MKGSLETKIKDKTLFASHNQRAHKCVKRKQAERSAKREMRREIAQEEDWKLDPGFIKETNHTQNRKCECKRPLRVVSDDNKKAWQLILRGLINSL